MKTRTHFTFRVDTWTPDGESIVEHVAGIEDYQVALATCRAACERWARHSHHLANAAGTLSRKSARTVRRSLLVDARKLWRSCCCRCRKVRRSLFRKVCSRRRPAS